MSPISSAPSTGPYIVRSEDAGQLADFIQDIQQDPAVTLVDTIGPANRPHTVVVAMSPEKALSLEQRFSNNSIPLIIEPDRPLSLFTQA